MPDRELREAVARVLVVWDRVYGGPAGRVDADLIRVYAATLESEGVAVSEFHRAAVELQKHARFFPRPAELLDAVRSARAEVEAVRRAESLRGLVECVDAEGREWLVPADRVGERGLTPRRRPAALPSGAAEATRRRLDSLLGEGGGPGLPAGRRGGLRMRGHG